MKELVGKKCSKLRLRAFETNLVAFSSSVFIALLWIPIVCHPALADEKALADDESQSPVVVRAISDASTIAKGNSFRLGVLFQMQEPWHIYWMNPGDSGLPTRINFAAPSEITLGEMNWPIPITFTQPGGIRGYGYENEALFWQEAKLDKDAALGGQVEIPVTIRWLRCSDTLCVPGRSKQTLKLSIGESRLKDHEEVFSSWDGRMPVKGEDFGSYGSVSTQPGEIDGKPWSVAVNWQLKDIVSTRWYLNADASLKLEAEPKVGEATEVSGEQTMFKVTVAKREGLKAKSAEVYAVIVARTKTGEEKALSLSLANNLS